MTAAVTPLETACEWRTDELGDAYVFQLTDAHLDELDAALVHAEARCDDVLDITREVVPAADARPELVRLTRDLDRRARCRAHPRCSRRAVRQGTGVVDLLGHRDAPRPAVAAERQGPPARRRHRPGPRRERPDVARQRDRRHRVPVPLRRLRPRRAVLPRRRRERRREPRRERGDDPQRAGAHRARARGRAVRAVPVRPPRRAGARARSRGTRCRSSAAAATGCSCATSARTSSRRAATTTRRVSVRSGARGDEPCRRDVRRSAVPRVDDDAARRHAVREQLPRAARARVPTKTTARRAASGT